MRIFYTCASTIFSLFFFFFQAEDGIRDSSVTGVQTCALPISRPRRHAARASIAECPSYAGFAGSPNAGFSPEIGRASCRERSVDLGGRRIIKKKKKIKRKNKKRVQE